MTGKDMHAFSTARCCHPRTVHFSEQSMFIETRGEVPTKERTHISPWRHNLRTSSVARDVVGRKMHLQICISGHWTICSESGRILHLICTDTGTRGSQAHLPTAVWLDTSATRPKTGVNTKKVTDKDHTTPERAKTTKKEKTSTFEATLTDVSNAPLKN